MKNLADQPLRYVIDANVALKLFFEQQGSERADALFTALEGDPQARFFVPDFFFAECANAFARYARQADYAEEEAKQDLDDLLLLGLHAVPSAELAAGALEIAFRYHVSGYDAFYIVLSQRLSIPLVTADEKMVRALNHTPLQVKLLSGFEIP